MSRVGAQVAIGADGLLRFAVTGELISTPVPHTVNGRAVDKWIYVVDAYYHFYVAPKVLRNDTHTARTCMFIRVHAHDKGRQYYTCLPAPAHLHAHEYIHICAKALL